jgi:hypothetical protein
MAIDITKKPEASSKPRSVFFQVGSPSSDSATAPLDPDPDGGRLPAASAHFAGRVGRESLVSNPDTDGMSLTIFHFAPGTLLPRHRHNVDYIEFVLEGEVHHGNRVVGPGGGVYRSGGVPYSFYAGPEGATIADFRARTWYTTEYLDDPAEWPAHHDWDADPSD